MPHTRPSVLDYKPATELRPGETGLRLKDDPYYGKVDLGAAPDSAKDRDHAAKEREYEKKERARIAQLPADQRPAAEKDLKADLDKRQKDHRDGLDNPDPDSISPNESQGELRTHLESIAASIEDGSHALDGEEQSHVEVITGRRLQQRPPDAEPRQPEDVTDPIDGEEGARAASRSAVLEPPERDRDKTRAAKPGESAKTPGTDPAHGTHKDVTVRPGEHVVVKP
jgi:hypothetical protein